MSASDQTTQIRWLISDFDGHTCTLVPGHWLIYIKSAVILPIYDMTFLLQMFSKTM